MMWRRLLLAAAVPLTFLAGCREEATQVDWSKLGSAPFTPEGWTAGDQEVRGTMVADMLAKSNLMGAPRQEVWDLLGAPTGYYDYDTNLAYVVGPKGQVESVYADGWMLVFLTDDGKVSDIIAVPDL